MLNRSKTLSSFFEMATWLVCLLVAGLLLPETANAGYLDPGSGSILVQGIVATIAFFGRIKRKFAGLFTRSSAKKS